MSNHPRVFERRDGDMIERVEVADVATAGWLVTRIVMTRYGVAVHAINIGNFRLSHQYLGSHRDSAQPRFRGDGQQWIGL